MSRIYANEIDNHILRQLQLTELEILDEIVRICEKFDIHYYLVGGTLLGAIRHEGFIPWDDDLDIAMPRADYIRFCNLCKTELGPKYHLHCIDNDDKYWLIFAKIRKNGTAINEGNIKHLDVDKGIYVDIFPLDTVQKEKKYIRTKVIKILSGSIVYKRGVNVYRSHKAKVFYFLLKPFSIKFLTNIQLKLMQLDSTKECQYYINYGSNYDTLKQTIAKDKYEPYKLAKFENKNYRIPNDTDYILRRIYNDYKKLPPEEKRVLRHKPEYIDFGEENNEEI